MDELRDQTHQIVSARQTVKRFEEAWKNGDRPDWVQMLNEAPLELRTDLFRQLTTIDIREREKLGEKPQLDEYLSQFPHEGPTISASVDQKSDTVDDEVSESQYLDRTQNLDITIGQKLGKYEIRSVLGVGGMGIVFEAYDTVIRRSVAIKHLSSKHSTDETALSRLLQEAQTAGSIHHPNIVGIYDVVEEGGSYFVVMEKVNGKNLGEILKTTPGRALDWKLATKVLMNCCHALVAAHKRGMIHRDVKPQNIMLTVESSAKLLDFGLAKSEETTNTTLTREGTILGTPDFMSPEQCGAGEVTALSDIYSLGATYFALLSGHPPFSSAGSQLKVMFAHCNHPVPTLDRIGIPNACQSIINKAMAKLPEDRFQSADEFGMALEEISEEDQPETVISARKIQTASLHWTLGRLSLAIIALLAAIPLIYFGADIVSDSRRDGVVDGSQPREDADQKLSTPFRGVTSDMIHLGTTTAFNGPNEELGRNMVIGMRTYFKGVNDAGGIHGRKIKLTVLDDRYVPDRALENMQNLFEEREVFAAIGNVGTPTAKVTSRYASENGYLFFAPMTGAGLLREDPPDRYLFNYRASYSDETSAMVKYFVEAMDIAPEQIAVFAQNDSYGDDGFAGVSHAMRAYGLRSENIMRTSYDRNQLGVDEAVSEVLRSDKEIKAIVMIPTYKVAARFVKRVRSERPDMIFGAVSFVGSQALAEEFREIGPEFGQGVIVTQVVPPYMSNSTIVLEYRKLLKKYYPECEPGFVSLEGFVAAALFVEGLERAGPQLTTESMIDALHTIKELDLGVGPIIQFGSSQHQASHRVWGTRLDRNANFETFDLSM